MARRAAQRSAEEADADLHAPPAVHDRIAYMDTIGLEGADALAEVVRRHPQVERVARGHLHRSIQSRWAGRWPARRQAPRTRSRWTCARTRSGFTLEPPGYALHLWRELGLVSHVAAVGDYLSTGSRCEKEARPRDRRFTRRHFSLLGASGRRDDAHRRSTDARLPRRRARRPQPTVRPSWRVHSRCGSARSRVAIRRSARWS